MKNCERSASDAGADLVERLDRQAAGIGRRLQHQRRHRADQHGLGHAFRAVAADVASDFAAAGGVADVDRVLQVERFDERRQVVGVGVHVVAVPGLARSAVAAAVVGDAAIAVGGQKDHLVFPGVGAQRPAVAEDDGLPAAPVLVVKVDGPGVLPIDREMWHPDLVFPGKRKPLGLQTHSQCISKRPFAPLRAVLARVCCLFPGATGRLNIFFAIKYNNVS